MAAIEPNWPELLIFIPAWLVGCAGAIYISGTLPLHAAPRDVQAGIGPLLVWLNVLALLALVVTALVFAVTQLRWTTIFVTTGFVFLFAPFAVQDLPERLRDTRLGLMVLLCISTVALVMIGFGLAR